jgi:DNA-binding NarL/FixJ family response regulator
VAQQERTPPNGSALPLRGAASVLIIGGHPVVHDVLRSIVRSVLGDVRLRTVKNLEGVVAVVRSDPKLDLVLLDLDLPGYAGIESLKQFRSICPAAPVIVISADDSRATILAAFKAGAIGYLPKTMTRKVMTGAMHVIAAGGSYVPYEALGDALPALNGKSNGKFGNGGNGGNGQTATVQLGLTHRQYQVLELIQRGCSNRTIAQQLEISEGTVKQHVHAMFGTLRVSSRTEAIAAASRGGFPQE